MVHDLQYLPALGESDHICLSFTALNSQESPKVSPLEYDIRKTNYEAVKEEILNYNWVEKFSSNFYVNYSYFLEKLLEIVYKHSSKKISQKSKKKSVYMTNEALRMKNRKQKLWKKYHTSSNEYDRKKYISAKNGLRKLTRTLRRDFESKIARNAKDKPKQFCSYTRSRLKTRQKIPP